MKKRSRVLIISLTVCLIVAIGATMAYFFSSTEKKQNVFTMSSGIKIELAEPLWDDKDYKGVIRDLIPTAELGETKAQNFVPGRVIPKNPSVKNASDNDSAWIAIKLNYTVGDVDDNVQDTYAELASFAKIDLDTDLSTGNWKANADNTIFYYKIPVQAGDHTTDLFKSVTINDEDGIEYHKFNIDVTAYAVQAEGISNLDDAIAQLSGYINK